jgi:hypothetical protein
MNFLSLPALLAIFLAVWFAQDPHSVGQSHAPREQQQ